MIRHDHAPKFKTVALVVVALLTSLALTPAAVHAQSAAKPKAAAGKTTTGKTATKPAAKPAGDAATPAQIGTFGEWNVYVTPGKAKTCYALGRPVDRAPKTLKRDPGFIFISTRPEENVRNEISIAVGFEVNTTPEPKVEVGTGSFAMVAKGSNLWVKNAAEETPLLMAARKALKIVVRASSLKGNVSMDTYMTSGLAQALDRVKKECL